MKTLIYVIIMTSVFDGSEEARLGSTIDPEMSHFQTCTLKLLVLVLPGPSGRTEEHRGGGSSRAP